MLTLLNSMSVCKHINLRPYQRELARASPKSLDGRPMRSVTRGAVVSGVSVLARLRRQSRIVSRYSAPPAYTARTGSWGWRAMSLL